MNLSIEVVRNLIKFLERVPKQGFENPQEAFEYCEVFSTFQQVLQFQMQNLEHAKAARERAAQAGVPFAGLPANEAIRDAVQAALPQGVVAKIHPDLVPQL